MKIHIPVLLMAIGFSGLAGLTQTTDKAKQQQQVREVNHPTIPVGVHVNSPSPIKSLATPVEIPNIPIYPGETHYVTGRNQQNGNTSTTVLSYEIPDKISEARDWYENALNMYKWKLIAKGVTNLCAQDSKGNILNVSFSGLPKTAKYKSNLSITYVEHNHQ
jgi:hypothetical protein